MRSAQDAVDRAWRMQFSDLSEARRISEEAIALARTEGNPVVLGHACFQAAYAAIRRGALADARVAIDECLTLFASLDDARGLWLGRIAAALYARSVGDVAEAIEALLALEANPPATATASDVFVAYTALAMSYRFVGQLEPALKWHYRAVDSARESAEPHLIGAALCNLGGYHADLNNPEEACHLLAEALRWSTSCNADRTTVINAINLVQSFAARGLHQDALRLAETYLKAERYIVAVGYGDPSAHLTLALAYANVDRIDDAVKAFDRTRDNRITPPDEATPQVFWTYVEARIALLGGEPARAVDTALSLLSNIDETAVNSPADLMYLHATVAEAYEALGDGHRALFHERRRATIRDGLVRRAMQAASITHTIRSELEATRTERDRIRRQHEALEQEHQQLAALNAALHQQIVENLRLQDELKEQNYRDVLTGLNNRRFLDEHAPALIESNLRAGVPVCLVMLDVDHFKSINDRHGHGVGDQVLAGFGRLLRNSLRENDIVCRIGGEEFAMILPASSCVVARDRLQSVLSAFGRMKPRAGDAELPLDLTFSAGIVEAPANGASIEALLIEADQLLYKAKSEGRARIEAAADCTRDPDSPAMVEQGGSSPVTR